MQMLILLRCIQIWLILLIPLGLWTFFCYFKIKKWADREKKCSLKVMATVTEVWSRSPSELHMKGTSTLYKPILKTFVCGQEYIIDSAVYTTLFRFEPGQKIWIHINPDHPQDFIYDKPFHTMQKRLDIGICLAGWIGFAVCIYLIFF